MKNISSKEADSIFYGNFFDGYTEKVVLISEKIEKSILQDEYNEFIIFAGGLNVDNIDLSNNYHSIYAVKGLIETQTLILGDCVFAISGQLIVGKWIFLPLTEGVFDINSEQFDGQNENILNQIVCPLLVLFDRVAHVFCVYKRIKNKYEKVKNLKEFNQEILDDNGISERKVLKFLRENKSIFR